MKGQSEGDLGFSFSVTKKGDLVIFHHGSVATRFSRTRGMVIADRLYSSAFSDQQMMMARLSSFSGRF